MKTITSRACPMCGGVAEFQVPDEDYANWRSGMNIQQALPTLDSDQREQLITGTCGVCWKKLFAED